MTTPMTDREKVVKLATEVMGWTMRPPRRLKEPDYPCFGMDLDAMATFYEWEDGSVSFRGWNPLDSISDAYEMESRIPVALRDEYCRALWNSFADIKTPWRSKFEGYWFFTHATARQRCDAAISALEAQHG